MIIIPIDDTCATSIGKAKDSIWRSWAKNIGEIKKKIGPHSPGRTVRLADLHRRREPPAMPEDYACITSA